MILTVLLGVVVAPTLEGHSHNPEELPGSLAGLLGTSNFAQGSTLWDGHGDLLASSAFKPAFGRPGIAKLLEQRYGGWTITLGPVHTWPAGEGADTAGIAFVNWVYTLKKGNDSHKELFVAVALRRHVNPQKGPVEKDHDQQYRFMTVRVLTLPLTPSEQ